MKGERVWTVSAGGGPEVLSSGEFMYHGDQWWACTPNGHVANLKAHQVTEHPGGTITVWPSILIKDATQALYHGWLTAGVWRDA